MAPCGLAGDYCLNVCSKECTIVQAFRLCTGRAAHRGSRGIALPFHDHGTRRGEGSASRSGRSLTRKRPGTHCTGGWVRPRARLDRCGKSRSPLGFDPRTVQPIASRYTDYATRPVTVQYADFKFPPHRPWPLTVSAM